MLYRAKGEGDDMSGIPGGPILAHPPVDIDLYSVTG
jgi:hypothetical protein